MSSHSKGSIIGKILRRRYIQALSLIAFFLIISQIIIQVTLMNQQGDSRVINIAGRQRMLSQRINKSAFGLIIKTREEDVQRYTDELDAALSLWVQSHNGLKRGDTNLGLPGNNSQKIIEMFQDIEYEYEQIVESASFILKQVEAGTDQDALMEKIRIIQDNESVFLRGMDDIVFQYDSEAKHKLALMKSSEFIILLFTLITLMMEILFIFRPVQKQIEKSLEELETSRDNLEKLFETAPSTMLLVDEERFTILKLNKLAKRVLGSISENLVNVELQAFLELSAGEKQKLMNQLASRENVENFEVVINTGNDRNLIMLLSSNVIKYDDRRTILVGLSDITNRKEAEDVLKRYASIDEMTGLLNKRSGMLILENTFDHARIYGLDLSLCFIDLNDLKLVNDTYGHEEGDYYIKTTSHAIQLAINDKDAIFRYGGDEIVIILDQCNENNAIKVIERIQKTLNHMASEAGKPYTMSFSYGIANMKEGFMRSPESLLILADEKMYENKRKYKDNK
jgi:diguanylate cyclase (GGDEF)-like protein/PAS domain S-box-containing protein